MRQYAFWEDLAPTVGLIRIGPRAHGRGDPYRFQVVACYDDESPVELKGYVSKHSREVRDAIALVLLSKGFSYYCAERYKDGVPIPKRTTRIRLSSTFLKELTMTVKNAHDASVSHWQQAIAQSGDANLTALSQAVLDEINKLGSSVDQPGPLGAKIRASLPLADALDALAAAGADQPHDSQQQKKIAQAIHSSAVVVKHLINASLTRTGIAPQAV